MQKHWFYQCFGIGALAQNIGFTNVFLPEEQKTFGKPIKTIKTKISKLWAGDSRCISLEILVFMVFIGFANVFCS